MIYGMVLLVAFEVLADIFAKEYSLRGTMNFAGYSILAYITANIFWLMAMKHGIGLARGSVIFGVAQGIIAVILGIFWYKESYSTTTMIGVALGVGSIIFLGLSDS